MPQCRKCEGDILWIKSKNNHKPCPVDPYEYTGREANERKIPWLMTKDGQWKKGPFFDDEVGYITHWSTCPYAEEVKTETAAKRGKDGKPAAEKKQSYQVIKPAGLEAAFSGEYVLRARAKLPELEYIIVSHAFSVETAQGRQLGQAGDLIISDGKGGYDVVSKRVFELLYEIMADDS